MSRLWPLSPAQEAIWFEDQIHRGVGNTGFFSVTLIGELAETHVESACQVIVRRHTTLRSRLRIVDGMPLLAELPTDTPTVYRVVDVPCPPGEEVATTIAWRDSGGKRHFDLLHEPSVAFALLRHGPGRRTLIVMAHHLCFDGRSKFVFARDFAAALTALRDGRRPAAEPLPWPQWPAVDDATYRQAVEYWNAVDIATFPALTMPRGQAPTTVGTIGERILGGDTRQRLRDLAKANGTNLFGGLLAALAVTLYGYGNGNGPMVLCVPVDVSTGDTRDMITLSVNVVPVVMSVDGADTFATVLAKAGAARSRVMQFRLVPFQRLSVGKAWPAGARVLFSRVALSYLRMATDVPEVAGLDCRWNFLGHNSAQTFDLMLHARDAHDRVLMRLDFSGDTLDAVATASVAEHLAHALDRLLDRPSTPLRSLALLPAQSIRTAAAVVSDPATAGHPLAELCAKLSARHPDRAAAIGPRGSMSYRDLADVLRAQISDGDATSTTFPTLLASLCALGSVRGGGAASEAPYGHVASTLSWQARRLGPAARNTRTLAIAATGTREFWQECWLTWARGGTLVLPGECDAVADVAAAIAEHAIDTLIAPFPLLRQLATRDEARGLADVITPMDRLRPTAGILALVRSGVRLHAQYVHDRAGVVALDHCSEQRLSQDYAPILSDLADGIRVNVCGPDGHVLPVAVIGELVIDVLGGDGCWDRHVTGGVGELDRSGVLRYHGRADEVMQWAGQSFNIASLERHFATHPDVEEVSVVVRAHRAIAYLIPRAGSGFDVRQARLHLRRRAAVPGEVRLSHVHVVTEIPRQANGDVDRAALGRDATTRSRG